MSEAERTLIDAAKEVFGSLPPDLTPSTPLLTVYGWDSVKFVQLIVNMEKRMKIRFQASEVVGVKTWGELLLLVERKVG